MVSICNIITCINKLQCNEGIWYYTQVDTLHKMHTQTQANFVATCSIRTTKMNYSKGRLFPNMVMAQPPADQVSKSVQHIQLEETWLQQVLSNH